MHGRRWTVLPIAAVAVMLAATVALAASPHFTRNGTPTCTDTGSSLVCTGELAGLGNGDLVIAVTSDAEATFLCGAPGNANTAKGQNKIPFEAGGETTIDDDAIKNGRVRFSVFAPEDPPDTPTPAEAGCPNKNWQVVGLGDIDFSLVELTITQGSLLFTCRYPGTVPEGGTVTLSCTPA
jgi:hypothetical protein